MSSIRHRLYALIIRLHPAEFRTEFGAEMELDFHDGLPNIGFGFLCLDALRSLGRQWAVTAGLAIVEQHAPARPSLLAGQYVMASPDGLTLLDFTRASVLCFIFYLAIGSAMTAGRMMTEAHAGAAASHGYSGQTQASPADGSQASSDRHAASTGNAASPGANQGSEQTRTVPKGATTLASRTPPLNGRNSWLSAQLSRIHPWMWIVLAGFLWLLPQYLSRNSKIGRRVVLATLAFVAVALPIAFAVMHRTPVYGQILHAASPRPAFEVVSVRPWKPAQIPAPPPPPDNTVPSQKTRERIVPLAGGGQTTDRVRMILPPNLLIAFSYGLTAGSENRILGGPDWISSDQYEFQAKIDDATFAAMQKMPAAQQREQVALMEQSLLADRFGLKVHFETREMPVFALTVAKGAPKVTPAKAGETPRLSVVDVGGAFQMTATAVSLDAWLHSPFLGGRQIVDQTGLKGLYDFQLTWRPTQLVTADDGHEAGSDQPPLLTAIQEQLGLKLVQTKGPVEVIVIDHIERPSPN